MPGVRPQPIIPVCYKTKMCEKYDTPEGCSFGPSCLYAHGSDELRSRKDNAQHGVTTRGTLASLICEANPGVAVVLPRRRRRRRASPADASPAVRTDCDTRSDDGVPASRTSPPTTSSVGTPHSGEGTPTAVTFPRRVRQHNPYALVPDDDAPPSFHGDARS